MGKPRKLVPSTVKCPVSEPMMTWITNRAMAVMK